MTDNEIIEQFESIIQTKSGYIWQDVLDLLKRLKAENERYRQNEKFISVKCDDIAFKINKLNQQILEVVATVKSEAITEFAEMLKAKLGVKKFSVIDDLVEELTEHKGCENAD